MLFGLSESMGWLGAQTMIGQYMHGKTHYAGRLSFIIRIGQLGAAPLAGVAWDLGGPWGAFAFMSVWGFGAVACALFLPAHRRQRLTRRASARRCARCCRTSPITSPRSGCCGCRRWR